MQPISNIDKNDENKSFVRKIYQQGFYGRMIPVAFYAKVGSIRPMSTAAYSSLSFLYSPKHTKFFEGTKLVSLSKVIILCDGFFGIGLDKFIGMDEFGSDKV